MGNASEFITMAVEENLDAVADTKTYADYIATRPRAERFGSHGLFTDEGVEVQLSNVSQELNAYKGNVYTAILSLKREDAARLGFDNGSRWRDFLRGQGKPRHIHKHNTAAQGGFKGNAPGSEPEYSFHWIGGGDTLFLFEAPIDMLSFISLNKQRWKSSSYAAACGVTDKVLWQTLIDRPYITKVCICLDDDEPGQKAAQRISKTLGDKNICNKILVPTRKDWNEDLLFLQKEGAK